MNTKPLIYTFGCAAASMAFAVLCAARAEAQTAAATPPATPADIVESLKFNAGNPPKARASFAKGQCVRGSYTPSAQAAQVTKSRSFTLASPVLARFSVGGGNPMVTDTNRAVLRGIAFKLGTGDQTTDLLLENAPVHFAKTLDQMLAFLKVRRPGADGKPDADKLKAYSAENPETLNQAHYVAARPLPGSFAATTYWAVHSYPATNAKGQTRFVKFKLVPTASEITLTDEEAKTKAADFLQLDLAQRIANGGIKFDLLALLDRPGDPTLDITVRWPDEDNRESVRLGTVTISAIEKPETCDQTIFNPSNLADGISRPLDELFAARSPAYAISLGKRRID